MVEILTASGIEKHFGGVHALRQAHVTVRAGEVHALMGENGAGKSTLGKILAGAVRPDAGAIALHGREVRPANPREAQRLGIGIIYQELDVFPHLTIAENIAIGNLHFNEGAFVRGRRLEAFCRPFLERVGLAVSPNRLVGELSMGQMQLVAIARALSMEANVLVMDESTSSLTGEAVENLFGLIGQLKQAGVAIIYVSHKMDEILRIADRVTVLRDGSTVGTRDADKTTVNELIRLMVGREVSGDERFGGHGTAETLLELQDVGTARIAGVSFCLRRGEVLGVAGLVGSGRTELGRALVGLDRLEHGRMTLGARPYAPRSPREAVRRGLALVPEDRKLSGLMMHMSVRENASLASLGAVSRRGWIRERSEADAFGRVAARTRLKAGSPRHEVSTLSGGNQQKVLLGRWLMRAPEVYFLDDPTRGVDVGAKADIYAIIDELARAGKGILMTSSELPELLRCSDRILVMNEGRAAGIVNAAETTQEAIMTLATAVVSGGRNGEERTREEPLA